ncbi:biotin-dependent carboxylase uncharacterized domain-containing protein [Hyunsoonleella jejuensis]|uniref:Biotin-dependent carboxylase uncharacterized domain-containing protein n=1 Tax=Hyunsoonleella jejuensis TaxID=419940 RepID=A0A1H9GU40_9FLAO|nr:biotin-dependent carboxyltransferase family protein [Hyunsoonleella jejuensis]SEQ53539.1 biotin-dependent carboxylase uncharacterized domain-containing protein [Hyunsoonleella jejuensis]
MVKVLSAGLYTTIQDNGRMGYQHYGVPVSGVMDSRAAAIANALVGNNQDAAVLEITMSGPKLVFEIDAAIAITGANMKASINKNRIENNRIISIKKGDVLRYGTLVSGFRTYLAVSGGFKTKEVLGSKSMYQGITEYRNLKKGDVLNINKSLTASQKHFAGLKIDDSYLTSSTLEVYQGLEFDRLSEIQKKQLFKTIFTVSKDNNRMAYQLKEPFENNLEPILTSSVLPGTVQLTPSGKLIVLMRDCQTTGGYPRVLQLSEMAINTLAQKFTGDKINFNLKALL